MVEGETMKQDTYTASDGSLWHFGYPWPGGYSLTHDDYDGAPEHSLDDQPGDHRTVDRMTREACIEWVEEQIADGAEW